MRIEVDGARLFFDVEGAQLVPDGPRLREKPTLLLLHGGPGFDHSVFKPWFSQLQDVAQLIYLDHGGNGRSDPVPPERLTLERWGDDVVSFCDALGIQKPVVLGVSFGGFVAQAYATRHPQHPRALVLCNTAARFRVDRAVATFERLGGVEAGRAAADYLQRPTLETLSEFARLCTPVYNRTPQDPEMMLRALAAAKFDVNLSFFAGQLHTFNFLDSLARVSCPTLVIGSEEDPITPIADSEDLVAALPAAVVRFERFASCGHPAYQDDEAGVFRVLREFLASL